MSERLSMQPQCVTPGILESLRDLLKIHPVDIAVRQERLLDGRELAELLPDPAERRRFFVDRLIDLTKKLVLLLHEVSDRISAPAAVRHPVILRRLQKDEDLVDLVVPAFDLPVYLTIAPEDLLLFAVGHWLSLHFCIHPQLHR